MKRSLPKILFITFSFFCLFISQSSFAQGWEWSKGVGGTGNDGASATATDPNGNVVVTGYFTNVAQDFFVTKYNPAGNIVWSKYAIGLGNERGNSVACDSAGNVYVTGNFESSILVFGTDTLRRIGNKDIFIAKYDALGNPVWARSAQGTIDTDEESNGITVDPNGDILIAGGFGYDTLTFGSFILTTPGVFVAKYDPLGNVIWAKVSAGGTAAAKSIDTDGNGNVYITGVYGNATIGFGGVNLTNSDPWGGTWDMFVFKLNPSGNVVWGKRAGAFQQYDVGQSIAVDSIGNAYITGGFGNSGISFGTFSLSGNGASESYLVKYSPTGTVVWARSAGGSNWDGAMSVTTDKDGNIYQAGQFMTNISFDMFTLNNPTPGTYDVFIAKYDPAGNAIWARSASGENSDFPFGIAVSDNHDVYVVGEYTSIDLTFGNTAPLSNAGINDIFLAKYHACTDVNYAPICIVTVDSLSQNNIITWDKSAFTNSVDSFIVYREVQSNLYLPLGAVPFDSLSLFVDTARAMYFPTYFSTGDPNSGTYRYKISVRDTCGSISQMSAYHNTIFIANNSGTFSWPQLYSIEGQAGPVAVSYVLMRDDFSTGAWHGVGSVSGTQQIITDPQYSSYQNTGSWYVRTMGTASCEATRGAINTSRSNIRSPSAIVGIKENVSSLNVTVYPNPAVSSLIIEVGKNKAGVISYKLVDVLGQMIVSDKTSQTKFTIDLTGFAKGVYFLSITDGGAGSVKKIIVE